MFSDKIGLKAISLGFVFYLILSVALFVVIFQFWVPAGKSADEIRRLAEMDPYLLAVQTYLGTALGIAAGYVTCRLAGSRGLMNSLILGGLFIGYGVVGIFLHPAHPTAMQIGKLLSPVPLTLIGGGIALLLRRRASAV